MRAPYVAAAALLLAATSCTAKHRNPAEPPPPIATDACPAPGDLLAAPPPKDGLPDVSLRCIGHDGTVRMSLLGKTPTVVNLWASWCFPCRSEMPDLQRVHTALGAKVRFLGVDTKDFENAARAAIQRAAVSYASVFDGDEKLRNAFGARTIPTTLFVAPDGTVKNVHFGQLTAAELRAAITKYLGVT